MSDCIFCKIVAKDIPCAKLYEDDEVLAFMDINPGSRGHCLVIPKAHHETIHDMPDKALSAVILAAKKVADAIDVALEPAGLNLHQSNKERAGQVVPHFHLHLLPRYEDDSVRSLWRPGDGGTDYEEVARAVAEKL